MKTRLFVAAVSSLALFGNRPLYAQAGLGDLPDTGTSCWISPETFYPAHRPEGGLDLGGGRSYAMLDADYDGTPDVVKVEAGPGLEQEKGEFHVVPAIRIMSNDGNGNLKYAGGFNHTASAREVNGQMTTTVDINGDGVKDLVIARKASLSDGGGLTLRTYISDGNNKFTPGPVFNSHEAGDPSTIGTHHTMIPINFDGDSRMDIAVSVTKWNKPGSGEGLILILRNEGDGFTIAARHELGAAIVRHLKAEDIVGDKREDLVYIRENLTTEPRGRSIVVLERRADVFTPSNVLYPPSDPTFRYPSNVHFAIGNIAGDDRKEIVAIASRDKGDRLVSYSLTGNGFQAATLADLPGLSPSSRIAVADMTGDNTAEIILLDGLTVTIKRNEGGRFRSEQSFNINSSNASLHGDVTPFESGSPPDHLSVVDANSDGLPDLFLGREYSAEGGAAAGFLMNSGSCG